MPVADIVVGVDMSDTGITEMDVLDARIPGDVANGPTRPAWRRRLRACGVSA
jgi:hypothetical protein